MPGEKELSEEVAKTLDNDFLTLERTVVLGLCTFKKWDKIRNWEETTGSPIEERKYQEFLNGFTKMQIQEYHGWAKEKLQKYAHHRQRQNDLVELRGALQEVLSEISEKNSNGEWWKNFRINLASSFVYSLLLVFGLLIVALFGSDLSGLLKPVGRLLFGAGS